MGMNPECKNCTNYKEDCGHHFKDENGHINYEIPSEIACDRYGNCDWYEETRSKYQIALDLLNDGEVNEISPQTIREALIYAITGGKSQL